MLQEIRRVLEARRDVRLAYVFGSAARGEVRSRSDVDIALLFDQEPAPDARVGYPRIDAFFNTGPVGVRGLRIWPQRPARSSG